MENNMRSVLCVIEGRGDRWEAACLDLDIFVAGSSFDGTMRDLEKAVALYIEAAEAEPQPDRDRLLARKAPLSVRLRLAGKAALGLLLSRFDREGEGGGSFRLPCPA